MGCGEYGGTDHVLKTNGGEGEGEGYGGTDNILKNMDECMDGQAMH